MAISHCKAGVLKTLFKGIVLPVLDASASHCCSLNLSPQSTISTPSTTAPSLLPCASVDSSVRSASKHSLDFVTETPFSQYESSCSAGGSCRPGGGEEEEDPRMRAGVLGGGVLGGGGMGGQRALPRSDCSIQLICRKNCKHAGSTGSGRPCSAFNPWDSACVGSCFEGKARERGECPQDRE